MLVGVFRRGVVWGVLGWLAVAAGAVTVGVLAVTLVGSGLTSGTSRPLSSGAVTRALASSTPVPSASPAAVPSVGPAVTKPFTSAGGTAYAQCVDGQAYLTSWSPHPGYETDEVERGPAARASVRFEADDSKERIIVQCAGDVPRATYETESDD
jgi:hypothetical protein